MKELIEDATAILTELFKQAGVNRPETRTEIELVLKAICAAAFHEMVRCIETAPEPKRKKKV